MIPLPSGFSRRDFLYGSGFLALAAGWQCRAQKIRSVLNIAEFSQASAAATALPPKELTVLEDAIQNQTMLGSMPSQITTTMGMVGADSKSNTLASNRLGLLGMASRA